MDVGFNNTNTLHLALGENDFKDVEWLIEATSNERHAIWNTWHEKVKWEHIGIGYGYTITELHIQIPKPLVKKGFTEDSDPIEDMGIGKKEEVLPVGINFNFAIVNGHKVAFYESLSLLVHHGYIEAFLKTYFQRTHDDYSRWNHVDSSNVHNCFNYFDTIDKKPRKTKYNPESFLKHYYIFKPVE